MVRVFFCKGIAFATSDQFLIDSNGDMVRHYDDDRQGTSDFKLVIHFLGEKLGIGSPEREFGWG